ncbi:unnamed protein product, partial [Polarella glacialis]
AQTAEPETFAQTGQPLLNLQPTLRAVCGLVQAQRQQLIALGTDGGTVVASAAQVVRQTVHSVLAADVLPPILLRSPAVHDILQILGDLLE